MSSRLVIDRGHRVRPSQRSNPETVTAPDFAPTHTCRRILNDASSARAAREGEQTLSI